jgi:hypothetical protein
MELYLAVFAGCLLFLLLQLNSVYTLPSFKWKTYIKTNWIPTLINLIFGFVCVYAKESLVEIYPITFISAMVLGISGQATIKKVVSAFDPQTTTVVGL